MARFAFPCLALVVLLPGCIHVHHDDDRPRAVVKEHAHKGPPPHAPAHGYRRKHATRHRQVELVYDAGCGAYVVVGLPHHFFQDERFYRRVDGRWQASMDLDEGWLAVDEGQVPRGIVVIYADPQPRHGKRKDQGHPHPAKHGY
jgi:hypothetical protein